MIEHYLVTENQKLSEELKGFAFLEYSLQELLWFGAIYRNGERLFSDVEVQRQDVLRIHCRPKRFSAKKTIDAGVIVSETSNFIIVNKASGLPTHASLDNAKENLFYQLQENLKIPLFLTTRLDVETSGLLVFAKNRNFQKKFMALIESSEVEKFYEAKSIRPVIPGFYRHYMKRSPRAPKEVFTEDFPGALPCDLEVISSKGLTSRLRLVTGRTHQIRAQLAAMGAPIVGDELYGAPPSNEGFGLKCQELRFEGQGYQLP